MNKVCLTCGKELTGKQKNTVPKNVAKKDIIIVKKVRRLKRDMLNLKDIKYIRVLIRVLIGRSQRLKLKKLREYQKDIIKEKRSGITYHLLSS